MDEEAAVLIFDEVKTGLRITLGGMQEWLGVTPDLTTLSKALANGYPIGALVGRREVMETAKEAHISATFNGETMSMAAALKTIEELERINVIDHIWRMGESLIEGLNEIAKEFGAPAEAFGQPLPPMPFMRFTGQDEAKREELTKTFFAEMIGRGILMHPSHMWFICCAHTELEIEQTLNAAREAMRLISRLL